MGFSFMERRKRRYHINVAKNATVDIKLSFCCKEKKEAKDHVYRG